MTNYKQLCAELLWALESEGHAHWPGGPDGDPLIEQARTALAEPEPEPPTDEEILELSQWHGISYTLSNGDVIYPMQEGTEMRDEVLSFTKAVLARWGNPAPQPIPVSERLPEPEDCDEDGWCWWLIEQYPRPVGPGKKFWCLCRYFPGCTHWLPVHALPLPS